MLKLALVLYCYKVGGEDGPRIHCCSSGLSVTAHFSLVALESCYSLAHHLGQSRDVGCLQCPAVSLQTVSSPQRGPHSLPSCVYLLMGMVPCPVKGAGRVATMSGLFCIALCFGGSSVVGRAPGPWDLEGSPFALCVLSASVCGYLHGLRSLLRTLTSWFLCGTHLHFS